MFIDVGARSRKEVEENLHIRAGLPITPLTEFTNLNDAGTYLSKALDDRVGLTAITEIAMRMKSSNHPNLIEVAASTQEELKSRGVEVLYGQLKPDVVINIEMSLADDFPALTPRNSNHISLGKGPALFVYDGSMIPNNKFVNFIIAIAKLYSIPLQLESDPHYGHDGSRLQRANEGIPVINIGIPIRYGHTQSGVMKRKDLDQLVELVSHILAALDQKQLDQINDL
jgi:putative aminopeptidase FrvX